MRSSLEIHPASTIRYNVPTAPFLSLQFGIQHSGHSSRQAPLTETNKGASQYQQPSISKPRRSSAFGIEDQSTGSVDSVVLGDWVACCDFGDGDSLLYAAFWLGRVPRLPRALWMVEALVMLELLDM